MSFLARVRQQPFLYTGLFFAMFLVYPSGILAFHPQNFLDVYFLLPLLLTLLFYGFFVIVLDRFWPKFLIGGCVLGFVVWWGIARSHDWGGLVVLFYGAFGGVCFVVFLLIERMRKSILAKVLLSFVLVFLVAFQSLYASGRLRDQARTDTYKRAIGDTSLSIQERINLCREVESVECEKTVLIPAARIHRDPTLCDYSMNEEVRSSCYTQTTSGWDEDQRLDLCRKLTSLQWREYCMMIVLKEAGDIQGCALLTDINLRNMCLERGM